jgi:SAM-dependent methyltransferase
MSSAAKRYDKRYFDKWYRNPAHRVSTAASAGRKAAMALAVAEYYLERPVKTVLDVGCGEGQWQPIMKKLRKGIRYTGVDPSEYAVGRFGKKRNLKLGGFGDLAKLRLGMSYDLIICSNILYYVPGTELATGIKELAARLEGVAFFEAYASDEVLKGDTRMMEKRDTGFYKKLFRRNGLVACGPHCYAGNVLRDRVTELERGAV